MDPELKQILVEMEQTISGAIAALALQTEQRFEQVDQRFAEVGNRFGLLGHEVRELRHVQEKILSDLGRYAILIGPVASGLGEIDETLGALKHQISEMSSALITQRTAELQRWVEMSNRVGVIERHVGLPEVAND